MRRRYNVSYPFLGYPILYIIALFLIACTSRKNVIIQPKNNLECVGLYISNDSLSQKLELLDDSTYVMYGIDSIYRNLPLSKGNWYNTKDNIICLSSTKSYITDIFDVSKYQKGSVDTNYIHIEFPQYQDSSKSKYYISFSNIMWGVKPHLVTKDTVVLVSENCFEDFSLRMAVVCDFKESNQVIKKHCFQRLIYNNSLFLKSSVSIR